MQDGRAQRTLLCGAQNPTALTVYVMAANIPIKVRELIENDSAAKPSAENEDTRLMYISTTLMFIFITAM